MEKKKYPNITYQLTFISLLLIFPFSGNLKKGKQLNEEHHYSESIQERLSDSLYPSHLEYELG